MSFDGEHPFGGSPDASSDEEPAEPAEEHDEDENAEEEAEGDGEAEAEAEDDEDGDGESDEDRPAADGDGSPTKTKRRPADAPSSKDPAAAGAEASAADASASNATAGDAGQPTVTLTSPSPQTGAAAAAAVAGSSAATSAAAAAAGVAAAASPGGAASASSLGVRPEALTAAVYDIVPTIAAPQSTSINVVTATPDLRWVFSGGSDGYVRKFNWPDTANGRLMLTVAQRHPFVDSVTKAGLLASYWENEDPQAKPNEEGHTLSPVYALAVHAQALWLLAGLESGAINLTSVRHDEGKRIHALRAHGSAVSCLRLAPDERGVLSGSWDKTVLDWDLHTGQVARAFDGSNSQISALELRPRSALPVPRDASDGPVPLAAGMGMGATNGTLTDNNAAPPHRGSAAGDDVEALFGTDGLGPLDLDNGNGSGGGGGGLAVGSPSGSLFGEGDNDSLFGDADEGAGAEASGSVTAAAAAPPPSFGPDNDEDDEFSRAIADGIKQTEAIDGADGDGDVQMVDPDAGRADPFALQPDGPVGGDGDGANLFGSAAGDLGGAPAAAGSNLPLIDAMETDTRPADTSNGVADAADPTSGAPPAEGTVFLAASIDGSLRVWDKRQTAPVARVPLPRGVPPWCMGACWSPDGDRVYAGRRNGTVEEYSLHKGLRAPERVFRFPNGSGAVSAVRAMPNGRHLVCASYDILRLYDLQHQPSKTSSVPFLIVPGHRTGVISQLYLDPTCRFMISTAGTRGWEGTSTQVLLGYEINI